MMAFLRHPLFIYVLIACCSCLAVSNSEDILYEIPQQGDNFKLLQSPTVYYFSDGGKYQYDDQACFFSYPNPSFSTHYSNGGIKTIAPEIAAAIPLRGSMCSTDRPAVVDRTTPLRAYFSRSFWLDNFSELAHLLFYFLWGCSLLAYFKSSKHRYLLAFGLVFLGGLLLEIVQGLFIEGRTASWEDVAVNMLGVSLAALLFRLKMRQA